MKLDMTIDEALAFADEWSRGLTLYPGAQGWRVVCTLLAEEVRRRHGIGGELIIARQERDALREALRKHIRTYRVDDQAWDPEDEADRLMKLALTPNAKVSRAPTTPEEADHGSTSARPLG